MKDVAKLPSTVSRTMTLEKNILLNRFCALNNQIEKCSLNLSFYYNKKMYKGLFLIIQLQCFMIELHEEEELINKNKILYMSF
jgi:hypothetical protein